MQMRQGNNVKKSDKSTEMNACVSSESLLTDLLVVGACVPRLQLLVNLLGAAFLAL